MKTSQIRETVLETVWTEAVARQYVAKLTEYGHRAAYRRISRTINEEPYVEHSYDVVLRYQHDNERRVALCILKVFA